MPARLRLPRVLLLLPVLVLSVSVDASGCPSSIASNTDRLGNECVLSGFFSYLADVFSMSSVNWGVGNDDIPNCILL